jgi:hypothetical protein
MAYPENRKAVEERRFQLFQKRSKLPARHHIAGDDFDLLYYDDGKIVMDFHDKRKKPKVVQRSCI